jgi:hypothetical protein
MPTANIGKLAAQVTADSSGFASGIQQAISQAQKFASITQKNDFNFTAGQGLSGLQNALTAPLQTVESLVRNIPFIGVALAGVVAAVSAGSAALKSWFSEGLADVVALRKEALALGTTTEDLSHVMVFAGGDGEDFAKGLNHLQRELGAAKLGSAEALATFQNLGLSVDDLSKMTLSEKVATLADRLKEIPDADTRAAEAQKLLGRSALRMAADLAKGSAGMEAAIERAKASGMEIGQADANLAAKAAMQLKSLDLLSQGLKRQLAVGLAPIVVAGAEEIQKAFSGAGLSAEKFGDMVLNAAEFGAGGIAGMVEALSPFGTEITHLKAIFLEFVSWVGDKVASLLETVSELPVSLGGGQQMAAAAEDMRKRSAAVYQASLEEFRKYQEELGNGGGTALSAVVNFFSAVHQKVADARAAALGKGGEGDDVQGELIGKVKELQAKLQGEVESFGMGSRAVEIWKLAHQGAGEAALKNARALDAELTALEKVTELQGSGLSIYDSFQMQMNKLHDLVEKGTISFQGMRNAVAKLKEELAKKEDAGILQTMQQMATPFEKFRARLTELQGFLAKGLDLSTYQRAVTSAFLEMAPKTPASPAALEFGSSAAMSAVTKATMQGSPRYDTEKSILDVLRQILSQEKQQGEHSRKVAEILDKLMVVGI